MNDNEPLYSSSEQRKTITKGASHEPALGKILFHKGEK